MIINKYFIRFKWSLGKCPDRSYMLAYIWYVTFQVFLIYFLVLPTKNFTLFFMLFHRRFDFYLNLNLFPKSLFLFLLKEVFEWNFTKIVQFELISKKWFLFTFAKKNNKIYNFIYKIISIYFFKIENYFK